MAVYKDGNKWRVVFRYKCPYDIVNIGLHFFLKNVRPMLLPVMRHSTSVA